jgi:hypothetical protein
MGGQSSENQLILNIMHHCQNHLEPNTVLGFICLFYLLYCGRNPQKPWTLNISIVWVTAPCGLLKINRRFLRICHLHILGRSISPVRYLREAEGQNFSWLPLWRPHILKLVNSPIRCLCVDSVEVLGTEIVLKEVGWIAVNYLKVSTASSCVTDAYHRRLGIILSEVKVKINLYLCLINQALIHKGVWESECIDTSFLYFGTSFRWVIGFTPQPLYPRRRNPRFPLARRLDEDKDVLDEMGYWKFLILQELKLLPLRRQARSQSLYRFRYCGRVRGQFVDVLKDFNNTKRSSRFLKMSVICAFNSVKTTFLKHIMR